MINIWLNQWSQAFNATVTWAINVTGGGEGDKRVTVWREETLLGAARDEGCGLHHLGNDLIII